MNASDLASYDQRQARAARTAKRGYRGKYPDRISTVAGSKEKGVYLVITNEGRRGYFATRDMIAAGMRTSYDQVLGLNMSDLDWICTTAEVAVSRQQIEAAPVVAPIVARVIAAPALEHDAMMLRKYQCKLDQRMRNERKITANVFEVLKSHGWNVELVDDGDEETEVSTMLDAMELMFNIDDCHVHFRKGEQCGWFRMIFGNGNDGLDVIADHSVNLPLDDFEPEQIVAAEVFDADLSDMLERAAQAIGGSDKHAELLTAMRARIATMKGA